MSTRPAMSGELTQTPVATLSDDAWAVVHDLRLRGFRTASGDPIEDELLAAGVVHLRGSNLGLTPEGRQAHAVWARLTPGSEEDAAARHAYERFLKFNVEFLRICTDWQLKPDNQPNDHCDAAYDFKVLERLDRLDDRAGALLETVGKVVRRFAGYRQRLTDALDKISDDRAWLASPRCDSYHTVWMQLHEDLLVSVGVNRADEQQPE